MSISIVNGYVCTSSCDVAKAKKGQDPHPSEGPLEEPGKSTPGASASSTSRDTAVVLGGALADPTDPNAIKPVAPNDPAAASTATGKNLVDLLV